MPNIKYQDFVEFLQEEGNFCATFSHIYWFLLLRLVIRSPLVPVDATRRAVFPTGPFMLPAPETMSIITARPSLLPRHPRLLREVAFAS